MNKRMQRINDLMKEEYQSDMTLENKELREDKFKILDVLVLAQWGTRGMCPTCFRYQHEGHHGDCKIYSLPGFPKVQSEQDREAG